MDPENEHLDRPERQILPLLTRFAIFLPVAILMLAADLATKHLAQQAAARQPGEGPPVVALIPIFLDMHFLKNPGAFGGLFSGLAWFLIAISIAAIVAILAFLSRATVKSRLFVTALAFIAGGTAGNLYDRLVYRTVRDFLILYVPVPGGERVRVTYNFNVADVALFAGIGLWLIYEVRRGKREKSRPKEPHG